MRLPVRRTWLAALAAVTTALMMALLVIAAPGPARAAGAGFVQRCGTHFCVDGKTAYFMRRQLLRPLHLRQRLG